MVDELTIFNNGKRAHYNFKHLWIKINSELKQILEPKPDSVVKYAEFIHEYTHYLQSFTTINGISAMLSYFEAIANILGCIPKRIMNNTYDFKVLIKEEKENLLKSHNRLYWQYEKFPSKDTDNKIEYAIEEIMNPIFKQKTHEVFILNRNDNNYYHISSKVLRENMAQMATFHVRGIGDDAIMDYVSTRGTSYEYWIIFGYFLYNYPQIENKVIFTYYFCEFVLLFQCSGEIMYNLLLEIKEMYDDTQYKSASCFKILDELMVRHRAEIDKNISNLDNLLQIIRNKYIIKSRYGQFYSILNKLLDILGKGLDYRKKNVTIFNANTIITGEWVNNMCKIVKSPVIKESNNEFRVLFDDQDYVNEIYVFIAVTIVIDMYLNNEIISSCPFYKDVPICDEYKRGVEDICAENPFDIPKFPDGGCAFYNAALILGILPVSELEKYKEYVPNGVYEINNWGVQG
ncbi:hypothetical protein FACS1894172_18530 [Spirochaetia bacterium]|nr:hypothetical protein FACS1894172_18530 [Spirochaetia bacterium]